MKIEVWTDFVCPFCYIGKRRLEQAIEDIPFKDNIVVCYKSYELDPNAEEAPGTSYNYLIAEKYSMPIEEAKQMSADIENQAAEVGLNYDFDNIQHTNSFDAHRVAKAAGKEGKENEMVERLMHAYFIEGQLISDHEVLVQLAKEVGVNLERVTSVLESRKFTSLVRDDEEQATLMDVQGVPFFVFNEKYAVSGAQPPDVFKEVITEVYQEEMEDPKLQSLTLKNSETTYCTDGECKIDTKHS